MSMPSSSELVATSAGSRPAFSASSISSALLARQRAVVGAHELLAGQLVERCARRSARRRLLAKTIVLRWARISSRMRG